MRVICICCYRNEADILEAFVRHTAVYCDELILLDHRSTDESPQIARSLQREGLSLRLLSDSTLGNVEVEQTNRLLKFAAIDLAADWILSLDADEFITGTPDNSFLSAPGEEACCLKVRTPSYYAKATNGRPSLNPVESITHRVAIEKEADLKVFVPGSLARRSDGFLTQGKHQYFLGAREAPARILDGIALAHFSLRSPPQYAMKLASKQLQKCRHISNQGDDLMYYNKPYGLLKESYATFEESFLSQRLAYKLHQPDETLVHHPIEYRGAPLRYTSGKSAGVDRFIRELLELAEELARSSPSPSTDSSTNGVTPARISIELNGGPSPGHTHVINTAVDRARFYTINSAVDCLSDASEILLSLRADPGLIEISEIILSYANPRQQIRYGVEKLETMLRVLEGGAVIAATDVFRVLISKDPVKLIFSGWHAGEVPTEIRLRFRVEHDLVPTVLLSSVVLNAITAEQQELFSCRAKLETAQRDAARYRKYLSRSGYCIGSPIDFSLNGNSSLYIGQGWSYEEASGRWTDGNRATLHIGFSKAPKRRLRINALLMPFVHEMRPEQLVRVLVGEEEIAVWNLRLAEASLVHAEVPAHRLHDRKLEIAFEVLHPVSPLELGLGNDRRRLGVWFRSLDLQWAEAALPFDASLETPSEPAPNGNVS